MKFMKGLTVGILIGILLTGSAFAAVQYNLSESEWKVVVDGQPVQDERYPVLLMDPGYNYVAAGNFKAICEKAGIPFEANVDAKEIRITTKQPIATKSMPAKISPAALSVLVYTEPATIERDGVKLVRSGDVKILLEARGYDFIDTGKLNMTSRIVKDDKILVDDILIKSYNSKGYISYDFYIEHIKPLITD